MKLFRAGARAGRLQQKIQIYLPVDLLEQLYDIANQENRDSAELLIAIIRQGIADHQFGLGFHHYWQQLSEREQDVLALAGTGYSNADIAALLSITTNTVKTHLRKVLRVMEVGNKRELVALLKRFDFNNFLSQYGFETIELDQSP